MDEQTFLIVLLPIVASIAGYAVCWEKAKRSREEIWKLYERVVNQNFEMRDKLEKAELEKDLVKEEYFRKGFEAKLVEIGNE